MLALGALLTACSSTQSTEGTASTQSMQSAESAVTLVGVDEFSKAVRADGVEVIDVRTAAEYAAGHVPGATNIDVESAGFAQGIAGLDQSRTYAVYCRTGSRSRTATAQMAAAGFTDVVELDGGISAWVAAGQPIV